MRELKLERRAFQRANRELKEKREDEELVAMMKNWSSTKGRVEKEINRRIESKIQGNVFRECDFKTADPNKTLDDIVPPPPKRERIGPDAESDSDSARGASGSSRKRSSTLYETTKRLRPRNISTQQVSFHETLPTISGNTQSTFQDFERAKGERNMRNLQTLYGKILSINQKQEKIDASESFSLSVYNK